MARVKALMLGIDSLSYKYFMKCEARSLLTLLDSTYRGVTENKDLQNPASAWLTVLNGAPTKVNDFLREVPSDFEPLKELEAIPINIPITNPTFGRVSIPMDPSTPLETEISEVLSSALDYMEEGPVIAAITGLERVETSSIDEVCRLYRLIDDAVRKLVIAADEFIVFSPYGPKLKTGYDPYGVYLSSRPRPNEHETVKLWELRRIFEAMIGKRKLF